MSEYTPERRAAAGASGQRFGSSLLGFTLIDHEDGTYTHMTVSGDSYKFRDNRDGTYTYIRNGVDADTFDGDGMSLPAWRVELIDIDGITTPVLAEYDDNTRWNGWLCPVMDAWSVVSVLDELAMIASVSRVEEGAPRYEWGPGGALILIEPLYEDDEDYTPDVLLPDEDGLYALGSHAWVWSKSVLHTHTHGWDWTLGSHMCFDCDTVIEYCRENED